MAKQYSRVRRGMVFWFDPTKSYNQPPNVVSYQMKQIQSHLQIENRPWMVVSNDEGNLNGPTCNIVPITQEPKPPLPCHVKFTYEGRIQTALCEQIRTVDSAVLKDFMYIVSDSVLRDIERALAVQFSIRPSITTSDFTLDTTLKNLEKIISQIIQERVNAYKAEVSPSALPISQIEDTAIHLRHMIEDLCGVPEQETKKSTAEETTQTPVQPAVKAEIPSKPAEKPVHREKHPDKPLSQIEKFNRKLQKTRELNGSVQPQKVQEPKPEQPVEDSKRPRNKWTLEKRKEYLEDCEKLPPSEVMKKWNLNSIRSVFSTKYACKSAISK